MFITISEALRASKARRENNEEGFTLIELLVVVLIIGILSAIAIPIFIGQQAQAQDAATKSDLTNAKTAIVAAMTDSPTGTWPTVSTGLGNYGYTKSDTVTQVIVHQADDAGMCLEAESTATGTPYFITGTGGASTTDCS